MSAAVADAVAASGRLGPWFTLPIEAPSGQWQTSASLLTQLPRLVERTQAALGAQQGVQSAAVDPRVAASTLHLALLGRVVSPVLGAAVLGGTVLTMDRILTWRDTGRHVPDLGLGAADGVPCGDAEAVAAAVSAHVLPLLDQIGRTLDEAVGLSSQVLRSNAASALHGAAVVMIAAEPALAGAATTTVEAILRAPTLRDSWSSEGGRFRRRGCCLYYRLPRGGLCADCVLEPHT